MFLQTNQLVEKLRFAHSGASGKQAFPEFYKYVLIEYRAEDGQLVLRGYNVTLASHSVVVLGEPEQRTIRPDPAGNNAFVFDPLKVIQSYSKIKDQVFLYVDFENMKIVVKSKSSQASNSGFSVEGFIPPPPIPDDIEDLPVPESFSKCIRRVSWASDVKSVDPACKGSFIKAAGDTVEFCSTDRTVIALCRDSDNIGNIFGEGIVPKEIATMIADMIDKHKECELLMNNDRIIIVSGDYTIISEHINSPMLNYEAVIGGIDSDSFGSAIVNRSQFSVACDFASQYTDPDHNQVFLKFEKGFVQSSGAMKDHRRKGNYKIPFVGEMQDVEICIEFDRLQNSIKALDCEEIKLSFDPEKPWAITVSPSSDEDIYTEVFTSLSRPHDS